MEINHLNEFERKVSLKQIFDRDIANNSNFEFKNKIIRPLKKENGIDVESLFKHLTFRTEEYKEEGKRAIKRRNVFDYERSRRLHWIKPHISEVIKNASIEIFSAKIRKGGTDVIRTFIFNMDKDYVIIWSLSAAVKIIIS